MRSKVVGRMLAMVLCLMLAAGSASAQNATIYSNVETYQDDTMTTSEYFTQYTAVGDTVYAMNEAMPTAELYRWRSADEGFVSLGVLPVGSSYPSADMMPEAGAGATHVVSWLFANGDKLMSIDPFTEKVFTIEEKDGALTFTDGVTVDLQPLRERNDDDADATLRAAADRVCVDGVLYVAMTDWTDDGELLYGLYAIDMTTGATRKLTDAPVTAVAAYTSGKLLVRLLDENNTWDEKTQTMKRPVLGIVDTATGAVEEQGEYGSYLTAALAYDAENDLALYAESNKLMGMKVGGEAKQVAYLPVSAVETLDMTDDGVLAAGYEGAVLRDVNLDYNDAARLTIHGWGDDGADQRFAAQWPEVAVYGDNSYYDSTESMVQSMVGGDGPDLLCASTAYGSFITLRDKGYCADLSGSAALMAFAERLTPSVRDVIFKDGKLYGIPVYYSGTVYSVDPTVLADVGLTMEDMPTNLVDLCAFLTKWNDEYLDAYPNDTPMGSMYDIKGSMLNTMLTMYMNACMAKGETISFNAPVFREMMLALENMRVDELQPDETELNSDEFWSRNALIVERSIVGGWNDFAAGTTSAYLPMAMTKDSEVMTFGDLMVLFVNPASKNIAEAVNMLTCAVESLDAETLYAMDQTQTEPVLNPYFEEGKQSLTDTLAVYKAQLETADASEKRELESGMEWVESMLADYDQYRYTISPEGLAWFKETLAPTLQVSMPTFLTASSPGNATSELTTLIARYSAGQLSMEQFIREADNKLRMMQLEGD